MLRGLLPGNTDNTDKLNEKGELTEPVQMKSRIYFKAVMKKLR